MLEEPEQGIADHVVVVVVGIRRSGRRSGPGTPGASPGGLISVFAVLLRPARRGAGRPRSSRRRPRSAAGPGDRADGGDDAAGALAGGELAVPLVGEGDRAAVRGDDQRPLAQDVARRRSARGLRRASSDCVHSSFLPGCRRARPRRVGARRMLQLCPFSPGSRCTDSHGHTDWYTPTRSPTS